MMKKLDNILTLVAKSFIILSLSISVANAVCGDGIIDTGEVCDLGSNNGNPNFGCNANCTAVYEGWDCNGGLGTETENRNKFNQIYNGMIELFEKIKTFDNTKCTATDKFPFNMDADCYTYESDLRSFISVNQSTPITCETVTSKSYTTTKKFIHNDSTTYDVKFQSGC